MQSTSKSSGIPRLSRSNSNIPLMRRESKNIARSKSTCRLSNNNDPPLRRSRTSDTRPKRSSSLTSLTRTPQVYTSKLSIQRTPMTGVRSSRTPFKSSSAKKDRPTGDKHWVIDQFSKVKSYLSSLPAINPEVLNQLKPPTINNFVYICDTLWKEIDPRVSITSANYKDVLGSHMKTLNFPSSITNSMLKTVNTQHNWPHVVNIWAWLVDVLLDIENKTRSFQNEPSDIYLSFLTERYALFNCQVGDDAVEQANDKFFKNITSALGVDFNEIGALEHDIEQLKTIKQTLTDELNEQEAEIDTLQMNNSLMKQEIEEFNQKKEYYDNKFEVDIKNFNQQIEAVKNEITNVQDHVKHLKETIANQPCSSERKKDILTNIESLKYTISLTEDRIKSYMKVKDQYDYEILELKRKIEAEIHRVNIALIPVGRFMPETKSLRLRDKGFQQESFQAEINEFINFKSTLEKKVDEENVRLNQNVESLQLEIMQIKDQIIELETKCEELMTENGNLEDQICQINEKKNVSVAKGKEECHNWEQKTTELQRELSKFEENFNELRLRLPVLENEKKSAELGFEKFQEQSLKFIIEINKIVDSTVNELQDLKDRVAFKLISEQKEAASKLAQMNENIKIIQVLFDRINNQEDPVISTSTSTSNNNNNNNRTEIIKNI